MTNADMRDKGAATARAEAEALALLRGGPMARLTLRRELRRRWLARNDLEFDRLVGGLVARGLVAAWHPGGGTNGNHLWYRATTSGCDAAPPG